MKVPRAIHILAFCFFRNIVLTTTYNNPTLVSLFSFLSSRMLLRYSATLTFVSAVLYANAHPSPFGSALAPTILIPRATTCNGHAELCNRSFGNITFVGAHDSYAIGVNSRTFWIIMYKCCAFLNPEFFYSSRGESGSIKYVVLAALSKGP